MHKKIKHIPIIKLGITTLTVILGISSQAHAVTFKFESNINGNQYLGTLEFVGEGTGLAPLFTTDTKLDVYAGVTNRTVYTNAGSFAGTFDPNFTNAPSFDVTNTTLDISTTGGMTFANGNSIDFLAAGYGDGFISEDSLGNPNTEEFAPVTFTLDSESVAVSEFSSTLGFLTVSGMWGISRLRKRVASKITKDITA